MLSRMKRFTLLPAGEVAPADRAALLNAAYADYFVPLHLSPDQMRTMHDIYDIQVNLSVVARAGGELAGLALLAQRGGRGWVCAVGVRPEWRRQGIARALMAGLLANARDAGMRQVSLEVIDRNAAARALYEGLDFAVTRELLSWRFPADADPLPIPAELLADADPAALLADYGGWHDQPPCWQREPATLRKMLDRARGYRLDMDGGPAAWCTVSDHGEAVSVLGAGINPDFGPARAGRVLLQALAHRYRGRPLTVTNVSADDGLCRALAALHFLVTIRQWEMRLSLSP